MLEKAIQENTEAINNLTELLKSGAIAGKSNKPAHDDGDEDDKPKGKKEKNLAGDDEDEGKDEVTLEGLRKKIKALVGEGKSAEVAKILKKFGAESATDLDEEHYAKVDAKFTALLDE